MSLQILKGGILSLVQDYGRNGYRQMGVSSGGPMDEKAFLWANYLLGNHYNDAQIEITMGMFEVEFTQATTIALCGASYVMTLNDHAIEPWQSYTINPGDILSVHHPVAGVRLYLSVQGGFDVPKQLGSCATVMREAIGGLLNDGRPLKGGDQLAYKTTEALTPKMVPQRFIPHYSSIINLRFIPNTSVSGVSSSVIDGLTSTHFTVSQRIDRMAYCLSGQPLKDNKNGIISQGVTPGSIQIPPDGQPIVLMKDCQTMGGYPIAGSVAHCDLHLLAQSVPGVHVEFTAVEIGQVEQDLFYRQKFFGIH